MSYNTVELNAGSGGAFMNVDRISGADFQRLKIAWGVEGAAVDASASNPLPVVDAAAVALLGTIDTDTSAIVVSLALLDDTVATIGSAILAKALQIAGTDGTNARTLKTDSSGELQVDVLTLPAVTGSVTADTELPAAATLADNATTPTAPAVGAFAMVYDGAQWDMCRGTAADGMLVNLGANNDVTVTGSVTCNAGTNLNTSALALESGGNLAAIATSLAIMDEWDNAASDGCSVSGDVAHGTTDAGEPVKIGMKAITTAFPGAEASGDRVNAIADPVGRQLTSHIAPAQQLHKAYNTTSTQTGTDVITPTSGKKLAITSIVVGTYATTGGRIIFWFGDNADTTYTAGTDQVLAAFSTAPSATSKPGIVYTLTVPVFCDVADRELHITTDAGISLDATIEYYEF